MVIKPGTRHGDCSPRREYVLRVFHLSREHHSGTHGTDDVEKKWLFVYFYDRSISVICPAGISYGSSLAIIAKGVDTASPDQREGKRFCCSGAQPRNLCRRNRFPPCRAVKRCYITHTVSEGIHSKIQAIKANARGFINLENYRTSILFFCGKLELSPQKFT